MRRVAEVAEGRLDLREALASLARRGVTRVFSEGGPTVGSALIRLGLADEVILLTAEKPLGRPGRPALEPDALAALMDAARYTEAAGAHYGPDAMRRWERRIGGVAVLGPRASRPLLLRIPRQRAGDAASRGAQCAKIASSSSATMLVILIAGFTAGPAVSL